MAFLNALPGAIAEGLIWGLMAIGVIGGGIVYYIVYNFVILLGLKTDYLKMLSAIIVALFLGVPYLKAAYFTKQKASKAAQVKTGGKTDA